MHVDRALQVLHCPPLDLVTNARDKHSAAARPVLRPCMADIFATSYVPDRRCAQAFVMFG
ncbi:hypothetical protein [Streptomyces sp. NPDC001537]